jgi:GNAT superfamily N-acetyltransferase
MTDLLGVCTSWGATTCVVQPEDGPPVTIELAHIVSGKPVPPRPSVRQRVDPRECQLRALALWPDLETEPVGNWLLRSSPTETARRANSVLAFGPAGVDDAYERVVAHYERPIAAVLPGSAEDELFTGHGWVRESHDADTVFRLAGVAQVVRRLRGLDTGAARPTRPTREELAPGVVRARVGDRASGIAAYADDWVGFRGIEVAPEHRGRGLALAVMAELVEWGAEQGATTAYLQVLGDNEPALRLYDGLGFRAHHSYRYLTPAPA